MYVSIPYRTTLPMPIVVYGILYTIFLYVYRFLLYVQKF